MTKSPSEVADELVAVVDSFCGVLLALEPTELSDRPTPDRWTIPQVIGHLVDSAANNHQRFVRAQFTDVLRFPKYDQNQWVSAQDYDAFDWPALVDLWRVYNRHLAHVVRKIPDAQLPTPCEIATYEPCSLGFLISDYLDHLNHHLDKIRERLDAYRLVR